MKIILQILFFNFTLVATVYAQSFEKLLTYGKGLAVCETADKGFAVAGTNSGYAILTKTDSVGDSLWTHFYGNVIGNQPENGAYDLLLLDDGGFILAGMGKPFTPWYFAYIIRTDASGNEIWHKEIPSPVDPYYDWYNAHKIRRLNTGGFLAAGTINYKSGINSDICLMKLDSGGNVIWQKNIDAGGDEYFQDMAVNDSNYIFASSRPGISGGSYSYLTITDTAGNILHSYRYGSGQSNENATVLYTDPFNGYYLGGSCNYTNSLNLFLNNYTYTGDTINTWTIPSSQPVVRNINPYSIINTRGNFYIAGYEWRNTAPYNQGFLMSVDMYGNELWRKYFGGYGNENFASVCATSDSGFVMTGSSTSAGIRRIYLVKTDSNGNVTGIDKQQDSEKIGFVYDSRNEELNIRCNNKMLFDLNIYTINGSLVKKYVAQSPASFSINELVNGVYFCKLILQDKKEFNYKFIKY